MKRSLVILVAATVLALSAQAQTGVVPTLNCVSYDIRDQLLTATFGYVSANSSIITVPISALNYVSPPPEDRGQPIFFFPGNNPDAWTTTGPAQQPFTWNLLGNSVTASTSSPSCGGAYAACWDTNGNGTCDPSEDINGDGVCNALDCQGRIGPVGATGPQGPTGPTGATGPAGPGVTAAITTVTVPSGGASATATCGANQVVLNGGGICAVPNSNSISGRLASSSPSGSNGWTVTCSAGNATAVALCAAN
jgi:hypothetical protein